jgi:excinuclease UvrABC nuclease subunit
MNAANNKTALYRYYDKDGVLLYVGISLSAAHRFSEHLRASGWASSSESMNVEWFPTRRDAEKAERDAILTEKPQYNILKTLPHQEMKSVKLCQEHWEMAREIGGGNMAEGIRKALDAFKK